jgi:hypothetical protein
LSEEEQARIARIAYRQGKGETVEEEGLLSEEDKSRIARYRPARDFEHFRRWQDQHRPEMVQAFEEARRRWHEKNDPPKG